MHEMTIALSIVDIVSSQAQAEQAKIVNHIEIDIGKLAGVMIDSLKFCFEMASRNTLAEGAELKINEIPGKGTCLNCRHEFTVENYVVLCPNCGGMRVDVIQGKEMKIHSINID